MVEPAAIVIPLSVPWSVDSAVLSVIVIGIVRALECVRDSVAVTVTENPSVTMVGSAESDTVRARGVPLVGVDQRLVPPAFVAFTRSR